LVQVLAFIALSGNSLANGSPFGESFKIKLAAGNRSDHGLVLLINESFSGFHQRSMLNYLSLAGAS
jgi:hypothetical protein